MPKNFPFYQQLDEMDCGATCLRMIARHYGRYYSLESLRELTNIGKQGVTMLGISDAAESIGFQSLAVKITFKQFLEEIPLPSIAHWKSDHFVVVYRITKKYVWIADPAAGKFRLTKEEFLENWAKDTDEGAAEGIVLLLQTTPTFFDRDSEKVNKSSMWYIFAYLKRYRSLLLQIVLGLLLGSVIQLIFPFLVKSIIDVGIDNADINFVFLIIIAQLVLIISQTSVEYFRSWILLHIGGRVNISIISDFLIKLTNLPIRFFDSRMTGDLLNRIIDHERVETFWTSTSLVSIFSLFNFIVFSIILFLWSNVVFLIFLIGTFLHLLWIFLFVRRRRVVEYKKFDQASENQSNLIELIDGMQEIKLHNAEKQKRWDWERIQARLFRTEMKVLRLDQLQRSGAVLINEAKNLWIIFVVASSVINGYMTLGMLVGIQYILGQLNAPFNQLMDFIRSYQDAKISLERMGEIHSKDDEQTLDQKITLLPEEGHLSFDNVSFHYNGTFVSPVLRNLSLSIPKNGTTAIVGASGSGKTTLLKLFLGIYSPTEGVVRLGDVNLNNINNRLWRSKCGWVSQDGFIFSETIAKNIALGDVIIDKQRMFTAAKVANIQNYIESLPIGYNTKIGKEGLGLSQGQRQRLLLARALYKKPEYLFLDEATSSLDGFSEMLIMENIRDYLPESTIIFVTHRLNIVKNADHIIVLDGGELAEEGTHEELVKMQGAYFHLLRSNTELSF